MKETWIKCARTLLAYIKGKPLTYISYAILTPLLLVQTAIEQHTIPSMTVVRDMAIYMAAFFLIAGVIRVYVDYMERELRQL